MKKEKDLIKGVEDGFCDLCRNKAAFYFFTAKFGLKQSGQIRKWCKKHTTEVVKGFLKFNE